MEKRRVRIYKTGGQQGSYINKTAKYFQDGGMQVEQEQIQPTQTLDDNQLISIMMQRLSKDDETANIQYAENDLAQLNVEPGRIKKLSRYVLNYIDDQRSLQDAQQTGDEETASKLQIEEDANIQAAQDEEDLLAQQQQRQQQLQDIYNDDTASGDNGDYDQAESDIIMRNGGMLNKKAYINNFIKLAKKQEGGDTEKSKPDLKTDIPINGREERISKFHNALKSTANAVALKEQAEKQYEQYMQQMLPQGYAQNGGNQFPNQDEDTENPMHHIGAYATGIHDIFDSPQIGTSSGPEQLQFGGWGHGKERRAARRLNRMMPQGFNQMGNLFMQQQINPLAQFMPNPANLGLANIDVRRTGIFGRPKEYIINFNTVSPVTIKDIEDTQKQEVNNAETTKKEVDEIIKEEETNTASTKNAEVAKASEILPDAENIYVVDDTVKNNSGTTVTDDVVTNKTVSKGTIPVVKKPIVKTPVTVKKLTDKEQKTIDLIHAQQKKYPLGYNPAIDPRTGKYRSMSAGEDDQAVLDLLTLGMAGKAKLAKKSLQEISDFAFKPFAKGFLPKGQSLLNQGKNMLNPGQGMLNPGQGLLNPQRGFQYSLPFQEGGFTDPDSGLYKFMGGGEDMEQFDLDYSDSKNISSPYFQSGGYFQTAGQTNDTVVDILDTNGNVLRKGTLAEAERAGLNHRVVATTKELDKTTNNKDIAIEDYIKEYMRAHGINNPNAFMSQGTNWNKPMGRAYNTGTLNPISGMIGPNAQVSSIDVRKTRMFGPNKGTPKKFTVNYNVPGQPGINASNTPKSYIGSDGQTHWMNNDNTNNNVNQTPEQSWRDNRNDRRTEKVSKWFGEHGKNTWTNNNESGEDNIFDENGMPTNDYAPGVIDNLRKSPISSSQYRTDQADENQADRQVWDLERLRLQNRAYGGEFLPTSQVGNEINSNPFTGAGTGAPLNYYKDPITGGYKNLAQQIYAPTTNLQGKSDKLMNDNPFIQNGNALNTDKSMGFDASGTGYKNEGLLSDSEKQTGASQQVSQKFKNKQIRDPEAIKKGLDTFNTVGNSVLGFIERAQQNDNIGDAYDVSNLYATSTDKNRGTYDQLGQFKPDETGFKGIVQYGGYMEEGGSYEQGGDTWMSEEQIQQFLAEGGELEFV